MTAPIDTLRGLIAAAGALRTAESPEAFALALSIFVVKAGEVSGCSTAEVKAQLDAMREDIRRAGVVEAVVPRLRLVKVNQQETP